MGNQSYAYAMGRVRAAERKMLSRSQFDRMIEARAADDAFRILNEAEYGGAGYGAQLNARDYERLLDVENERLASFITEISPEPGLLDIFLLRYDYHNLKVLLKMEFSGVESGPELSRSGIIEPEKLTQAVRERYLISLPVHMAEGVREAILSFQKSASVQSPDPQSIDIKLDKAMYAQMQSEAGVLGNAFIERLIRIYIDLANIASFLRMRAMGKSADFMRGALISGGGIDCGVFIRYLRDNLDGFVDSMRQSPYSQLCEDGVKSYEATGSLTALERGSDNYVTSYVKKAKLLSYGLEIIAAYFVARQAELKNVRIVMVGKINGIAQEVIRERLREQYV